MCLSFKFQLPHAEEFVSLRQETNWGEITFNQAKASLNLSLCGISVYKDDEIIGMARVLGDGILCLFIQDVIIKKSYRSKNIGRQLMETLIKNLQENYNPNCTIGLMAALNQSGFYSRFGFDMRPSPKTDAGMTAPLHQLHSYLAKTSETD